MDTTESWDDPSERETLPVPLPAESRAAAMRAFDTQAERFFSATTTLPGALPDEPLAPARSEAEELAAWWVEQRRRTFVGWVAAAMALCAGVLLVGVLYSAPPP
jgi:hypothetical protein